MEHSTKPISPLRHYLALLHQPRIKPRSTFWKAFHSLQKNGEESARAILVSTYFDANGVRKDSHRIKKLQALACRNIANVSDYDWPEMLAASGCSICISQLLKAGRISAVHAAHAEIEVGRNRIPNPHLKPSDDDMAVLLSLYDIEQDILSQSAHSSPQLEHWLHERRTRALTYFDIYDTGNASADATGIDAHTV